METGVAQPWKLFQVPNGNGTIKMRVALTTETDES